MSPNPSTCASSDESCLESIAAVLYEKYCEAVGGVAFNGDLLPTWAEFRTDANKTKQSEGWIAVAAKAVLLRSESCQHQS